MPALYRDSGGGPVPSSVGAAGGVGHGHASTRARPATAGDGAAY